MTTDMMVAAPWTVSRLGSVGGRAWGRVRVPSGATHLARPREEAGGDGVW